MALRNPRSGRKLRRRVFRTLGLPAQDWYKRRMWAGLARALVRVGRRRAPDPSWFSTGLVDICCAEYVIMGTDRLCGIAGRAVRAILPWLGILAPGCGLDEIVNRDPRAPANAVTPRATWKVSGSLAGAPKAVDDNLQSFASSGAAGAQLTIDLGKWCLFNQVIVDHGPNEYGFPRRMAVLTSLDGSVFTQQHIVPGTRRITYATLPSPVLARYVRLQAVVQGDQPWSVAEVYLR